MLVLVFRKQAARSAKNLGLYQESLGKSSEVKKKKEERKKKDRKRKKNFDSLKDTCIVCLLFFNEQSFFAEVDC